MNILYAKFEYLNQDFKKVSIKKLNEIIQFMHSLFIFLVFFDNSNNCFIN